MYTGTLITDLMAAVQQAEQQVQHDQMERELHAIYSMQILPRESDQIFLGAA